MRLLTPVLAAAVLFAVPAFAQESVLPKLPEGATYVTLSASADVEVPQDRLRINMQVRHTSTDQQEAQQTINEMMEKALKTANRAKGVKVTTGSYNVYQQRTRDNLYENWIAQQTLTLEGADFKTVRDTAGTLQGQGLSINGMSYFLSDEQIQAQREKLLTEAIEKVTKQASVIGKALGKTTVQVVQISTSDYNSPRPMPMMMRAEMASSDMKTAPQGQADDQKVDATVQAIIYLLK